MARFILTDDDDVFPNGEDVSGNDEVRGGAGDDEIDGGQGNDVLEGGLGADALYGGDGVDTAAYRFARSAVTLNLADPMLNTGDAEGDSFFDIERFLLSRHDDVFVASDLTPAFARGGQGDDSLSGGAQNDRLYGGEGQDVLFGGGGRDFLYGQAGDDILDGGDGRDRYDGGDGFDTVTYASWTSRVVVDVDGTFGSGHDLSFTSIEQFILTGRTDVFAGGALGETVHGGDGHDYLFGLGGDDHLMGEAGHDVLEGEAGDDILDGGDGDDALSGGEGFNILLGGDGFDLFDASLGVNAMDGGPACGCGGSGAGVIYVFATAGVEIDLAAGTTGGEAAGDTFANIGAFILTTFDDVFQGGDGDDSVQGVEGEDILRGGDGDDYIVGADDTDADALYGDAGDDFILAGDGDTVTGGDGLDFMGLDLTTGGATITDYVIGEDRFDVSFFWSDYEITGDRVEFDTGAWIVFEGSSDVEVQAIMDDYEAWLSGGSGALGLAAVSDGWGAPWTSEILSRIDWLG